MHGRERLIELYEKASEEYSKTNKAEFRKDFICDYFIANGVVAPPCKVGDTVYYINTRPHIALHTGVIYEAVVVRIVVTNNYVTLVIQIRNDYGCTEIPDVDDFGKTVFLTREEAEAALRLSKV